MNSAHSPTWIQVVAGIPTSVMLVFLLWWNPETKKQWALAAIMGAYVAIYYFIFTR